MGAGASAQPPSTGPGSARGGPTPASTGSAADSSRPLTLAFGGDVHFEGVDRARLAADPATAVGPIAAVLRRADLAVVNLETAVTTRGTPAPKRFTFRAPPAAFDALRAAGVDVATQANNHGMDFGLVGLRDSLAAARAKRFPVVGIGRDADAAYAPYLTTVHGTRIAVLGATEVLDANLVSTWTAGPDQPGLASAKDVPRLLAAVRDARRRADLVVVDLHWGTEMQSCPNSAQRALAPKLVAAGADVVAGSHAHVLLGSGWLPGTSAYVDYGLGNFVFYATSGPTLQSGVLTLTVRGRRVVDADWAPARISGGVPVPLRGGARDAALDRWDRLRSCTGLTSRPR